MEPKTYKVLKTQVTVLPTGHPIFSELATTFTLVDEAGGPFVEIEQHDDDPRKGVIRVDFEEWNHYRMAIDILQASAR